MSDETAIVENKRLEILKRALEVLDQGVAREKMA